MRISVIIPTLNEQMNIPALIESLQYSGGEALAEIIVVDAGSSDQTETVAQKAGAKVIKSPVRGRAVQMNYGVKFATGDILYFVHADTRVPVTFVSDIQQAIQEGYESGCYRFRFDSDKTMLKINNYLTHLNILTARGGDQTLFITRDLFTDLRGFDEYYVIMEEYDLLRRLWKKKRSAFKLIPKDVLVSARKYERNSWARVQFANLVAMTLFRLGTNPIRIARTYKKMLDYR
ncbi:TIGR04283 family arsenosugar biosynthesis glycosyltransferase [Runella sp.]|jgi:rSAM/selenodomain-associated transferase 2|uniref:TIGR04283 family arsenosugar biosynthesis glycosyltransferase n=1 Tax=Runella sp. TaxID=1960881 RepID=UPI00262FD7D5|nr:TIGR04283 family arsenosugar biosynthesis glycosyltransferase [Runella sp.]